jgi:hypothetical protein
MRHTAQQGSEQKTLIEPDEAVHQQGQGDS